MECKTSGCSDNSCGHDHHDQHCHKQKKKKCCDVGSEMGNEMVAIADRAWEELMLVKMKALWEEKMGDKMDNIARASVDTSMAYWGSMMKGKAEVMASASKIEEAMQSE